MEKSATKKEQIDYKDILQIFIGSFAAAIVFAPNNEYRGLASNLPLYKIIIILLITLIFSGFIAYFIGARKLKISEIRTIAYIIPIRLVLIYAISILSCLIALWIYDIINTETCPIIVIREIIVLSLTATWGGTLLDLVYTKNR